MSAPREPTGEQRVSFTVKELLHDLDTKLDTIVDRLDAKANSADVSRLEVRVTDLEQANRLAGERMKTAADTLAAETERRRVALENAAAINDRSFSKRERLAGLAFSALAVLVTVAIYFATH